MILFRGTDRIAVPDAVAADYEAEGWSRTRAAASVDAGDQGHADGPSAEQEPRARRQAGR